MENSNLDVWAIQKNKEEIEMALDNIKDSNSNILFRNCLCSFGIGSENLNVLYDTVLYSEESDAVILLTRNGNLTVEELKERLEKRNISFHEVVFNDEDFDYDFDESQKEIWFAREKGVVEDAFRDSKEKGINRCTYYPNVEGHLDLEYYISHATSKEKLDGRNIKGVIEFSDKFILLINQDIKKDVTMREVFQLIEQVGIMTTVNMKEEVESLTKNMQYVKRDN